MINAHESNNKTRQSIVEKAEMYISPFLTEIERKIAIACDNGEYKIKDIFEGFNITEKEISDVIKILNIERYIVTNHKTINVTTDEWTVRYDLSWEIPRLTMY